MPEQLLVKWWKSVKKSWKQAFFAAIIIGFLTHMYVFTNMLPNHDGIINMYSSQRKFVSGRFFLGPFSGISSYFDLPWMNGILSILYLAIMTVLLTELFELRKGISIVLTAGLVVTFPTVASTFSYMFTADAYMFANMLTVLAIVLTKKYKAIGVVIGSIIFYFSVGIYQANLPLFLTVVTVWIIKELVFAKTNFQQLLRTTFRFITTAVGGLGLYAITFKWYERTTGGKVTNYQGLDSIGVKNVSFSDQVLKLQESIQHFFFRGFYLNYLEPTFFERLNVALLILLLGFLILLVFQNKLYKQWWRILLLPICLCLLPIFSYILYFVSPGVFYHMLMVMSIVSIYLLPVIIYDHLHLSTIINKIYSWGTVVLLFLTIFNFAIIANIAYLNMTLKYEKSYAAVNRVLDRIEQMDGYENVTKLAIVGKIPLKSEFATRTVPYRIPAMIGALDETFLKANYHYQYMFANYFGVTLDLVEGEDLQEITNSTLFTEMEVWPLPNSVSIIDDTVIVKLSE